MTAVTQELQKVLADTFVLYFKTHSFHWNVEGMQFHMLHTLFEEQYTELWTVSDDIAERLRALEAYAPNNFAEILQTASLHEEQDTPSAEAMVKILLGDNEKIVKTLGTALKAAQDAEDEVTAGLLIDRMTSHEKTAWMLRSLQKGS